MARAQIAASMATVAVHAVLDSHLETGSGRPGGARSVRAGQATSRRQSQVAGWSAGGPPMRRRHAQRRLISWRQDGETAV
ncbi:hypothetical protein SL003B_2376 [Polymorphum gilvum SL003B-26A1]|uniref:Uncharacterized protein n=1 Tax=Polymorphum gilvum (strain LMG 25793 / CGMCC 1.9160 / SL003B-26A1) TaxID=991905 RepID=F2J1K1_POLGS|nr:hypothetical protein SL003B_2376 [Polymorphum gilvum SL003B-26A1]